MLIRFAKTLELYTGQPTTMRLIGAISTTFNHLLELGLDKNEIAKDEAARLLVHKLSNRCSIAGDSSKKKQSTPSFSEATDSAPPLDAPVQKKLNSSHKESNPANIVGIALTISELMQRDGQNLETHPTIRFLAFRLSELCHTHSLDTEEIAGLIRFCKGGAAMEMVAQKPSEPILRS